MSLPQQPPYQKYVRSLLWLIGGLLALGAFLDAISNAISLVTMPFAIIVTIVIILSWVATQTFLMRHPLNWKTRDGKLIRIKKLKARYSLPLLGMIMLLWLPVGLNFYNSNRPIPLEFEREKEGEILVVISAFDRAEGVPDGAPHLEIQQHIQSVANDLHMNILRVEVASNLLSSEPYWKTLSEKYNATVVIWGSETAVRISSNYNNFKYRNPSDYIPDKITETIQDDRTYILTKRLPSRIVFRLFMDIAQPQYQTGGYEETVRIILTIIETSLPDLTSDDIGYGYYFVAEIYEKRLEDRELANRYYCVSRQYAPPITIGKELDCNFPKRN